MKLDRNALDAMYPPVVSARAGYVTSRRDAQRVLVRGLQDSGLPGMAATRLAVDLLRSVAATRLESLDLDIPEASRRKAELAGAAARRRLMALTDPLRLAVIAAARSSRPRDKLAQELLDAVVAEHEVPS